MHPRVCPTIVLPVVGLAVLGLLALSVISCRQWIELRVKEPAQALTPLGHWEIPEANDDLPMDSLRKAIRQSLTYLERLPSDRSFVYGPNTVTAEQMQHSLHAFLRLLDAPLTSAERTRHLREEFLWLKARGRDLFGNVLFTGYYEPVLMGSLQRVFPYEHPIYRLPRDMVQIDLGDFRDRLDGKRLIGRLEGRRVVPYYSRAEIDGRGALEGRGLELLWLKSAVEAFFLHVQGSGQIVLPDGQKVRVNYAGTNGHPYCSIGRVLIERGEITASEMSMQAIRTYLLSHPQNTSEILFTNPSYVFFRMVNDGPLGSLGVPVTAGRSIATDHRLFPKGSLAFIKARRPETNAQGEITGWRTFSRFVLNQDTGGAIRGAGRVDLFCGTGSVAERIAGPMKHEGELYFLLWKGVGVNTNTDP